MSLGTAPSFLILGKGKNPNSVRWSIQDRICYLAVQQLQEEKCPHCGVPYWLAYTAHRDVEYAIEFSKCNACADLELRTKDIELKPGEHAHVHAVDPDGGLDGLPSRAEALSKLDKPMYEVPAE